MKKLLALLLAVAIVMTMSIPAFAEEVDEPVDDHSGSETGVDTSTEIGVYGNYLDKLEADKILSVVVSWTDMYFKYAKTQQGTWNPEKHTYDNSKDEGAWLNDSATITIANHSNTGVIASLGYTPKAEGVSGTLSNTSVELATAEGTDKDAAPSETVNFTISGTPSGTLSDGAMEWGTINVTLSANENAVSYLDLTGLDDTAITAAVTAWLNENGGPKLNLEMSGQLNKATVQAINAGIGASNVDSVALELKGATSIGKEAFSYGKGGNITSIYAPDVYSIYDNAFCGASSITSFIFPNVTSFGIGAFSGCSNMQTLTFGKMITSPGSQCFDGTSTENVTLTLSSEQKSGTWGNYYPATFGDNGTWLNLTWKTIQEYTG